MLIEGFQRIPAKGPGELRRTWQVRNMSIVQIQVTSRNTLIAHQQEDQNIEAGRSSAAEPVKRCRTVCRFLSEFGTQLGGNCWCNKGTGARNSCNM